MKRALFIAISSLRTFLSQTTVEFKILDFGLAKLTETTTASDLRTVASGTQSGVVLGTVGYMSPEQVRGRTVDHRSDIFNFGAILYEMFSGERAFCGDSGVETMNARRHWKTVHRQRGHARQE